MSGAVGYYYLKSYTIIAPAGFISRILTMTSTETTFLTIASRVS